MDKPKLDRNAQSILFFMGIIALSVIGLILEYYHDGLALEVAQDPLLLQNLVVIVNGMVVFSLCLDIFGDSNLISDQDTAMLFTLALVVWVALALLLAPLIEFAIALQIVIGFILFLMGFYQRLYHVLAPAITFVASGIMVASAGIFLIICLIGAIVITLYVPIFILFSDIVTTLEKYRMGNLDVRGRLVGLALILGLLPPLAIVLVIHFRFLWINEPMPPLREFDIWNFFPDAQWRKRFLVACGVGVLVFVVALVIFL